MTTTRSPEEQHPSTTSRMAMRFVLLIGVLSFFADFTHEGSRSILGPFLASMQASAFVVGVVTGFGELAGYALRYVSGRFADYPLLAYHFAHTDAMPAPWIAVFYSVAMAVSGTSSLLFGRLFDRYGFRVLIGLTLLASLFAPLVFLGGFKTALLGAAIWGMGMGVHESIIPAAVTPMVASQHRATAFGLFTAGYGIFWFLGSATIGFVYDYSVAWTIVFCVVTQLLAIPLFVWVGRRQPRTVPPGGA